MRGSVSHFRQKATRLCRPADVILARASTSIRRSSPTIRVSTLLERQAKTPRREVRLSPKPLIDVRASSASTNAYTRMRGTLTRTGSGEPGARVFPRAPGPQSLPAPEYSVRDQPAANPGQRSHGGGERLAARERPFQRLEVERSSVALWWKGDKNVWVTNSAYNSQSKECANRLRRDRSRGDRRRGAVGVHVPRVGRR